MQNDMASEKVPQEVKFDFNSADPALVQECRKIINYGNKRAREVYGYDTQKWRQMEKECVTNADYLRLITNIVRKAPSPTFHRFKTWRLLEYTPQACVIKFGERLFDPLTISYAEVHMPLSVIRKIRG